MYRWLILSISFMFFLAPNAQAQSGSDSVPPPLNPYENPWPTPPSGSNGNSKGSNRNSGSNQPGGPNDSNSPGAPPPPPPSFDPFGGSPSSGSSSREGKSSFVLEAPSNIDRCDQWSNVLLSGETHDDFNDCRFALERKVEKAKQGISQTIDRMERKKLKSVIRGHISRQKSKQYSLTFDQLRETLDRELSQGCLCVKN